MGVVVSPPPPKTDAKFDDWMYLFWKMVRAMIVSVLPAGGAQNYVLTKLSATDYDFDWAPVPTTDLVSPGNNIVHNSYFQEREYAVQDDVVFATTAPYSQHARRWYGVAPTADFKTLIDIDHYSDKIIIKRTAGSNTGAVRLIQILDTEDSKKFTNKDKTLWVNFGLQTGANVTSVTFYVYMNTGIDESLDSYIADAWSNKILLTSGTVNGGYNFTFDEPTNQIAFEIEVIFDSTASATDDEVFVYSFIVTDRGNPSSGDGVMVCSKSRAITRQECNRYYQQMDLYLTTAEISVPIHMRDVPTVTLGDAAAFTTTGTTADALVIKVNGAGDNGIHTVYLDCEL
jgi:hypothetical protein